MVNYHIVYEYDGVELCAYSAKQLFENKQAQNLCISAQVENV